VPLRSATTCRPLAGLVGLVGLPGLVGLEVRRRVRTAGALALAGLAAAAVAAAYALSGAGAALEAAAFVVTVACAVVAVGAASSAPDDRASGAGAWLAATGASPAVRRLAPALAAGGLAIAAGLVAGVLVAAFAAVTGRTTPVHVVETLRVDGAARLVASSPTRAAARAVVPTGPAGATWELDVRPVFRAADAAGRGTTTVALEAGGVRTVHPIAVRGPSTFPTVGDVAVETLDPDVDLRVVAARRRTGDASFAGQALLLGLLLGAAAASGAPLAALLARGTSAPTAALAAALLLLVGATRDGLLELAAGAAGVAGGGPAAAVLRGAVAVAPDLAALGAIGEVVAGRALGLASWALLAPAAVHALATSALLALLPARGGLS